MLNSEAAARLILFVSGEEIVVFGRDVVHHAEVRGGMMVSHRPHLNVGTDSSIPTAR